MMEYRARNKWIIFLGIFSIAAIFFYADLKQKINQYSQLLLTERKLLSDLQAKKNLSKLKNKNPVNKIKKISLNTVQTIGYLDRIARMEGFSMKKIYPLKNISISGIRASVFKISMLGDFLRLKKLMNRFAKSVIPLVVDDFSLRINQQGEVEFEMRLLVFYMQALTTVLLDKEDTSKSKLYTTSLQELKWVGYLQKNSSFFGLVMLPDGNTVDVKVGSVIGKENARVILIDQAKMVVEINGNKSIIHYSI